MRELWESRVWSAAAIVGFCFGALGADAAADRVHAERPAPREVAATPDPDPPKPLPNVRGGSKASVLVDFGEIDCEGGWRPGPGQIIDLVGLFIDPGTGAREYEVLVEGGFVLGIRGEGKQLEASVLIPRQAVQLVEAVQETDRVFPRGCPP